MALGAAVGKEDLGRWVTPVSPATAQPRGISTADDTGQAPMEGPRATVIAGGTGQGGARATHKWEGRGDKPGFLECVGV